MADHQYKVQLYLCTGKGLGTAKSPVLTVTIDQIYVR